MKRDLRYFDEESWQQILAGALASATPARKVPRAIVEKVKKTKAKRLGQRRRARAQAKRRAVRARNYAVLQPLISVPSKLLAFLEPGVARSSREIRDGISAAKNQTGAALSRLRRDGWLERLDNPDWTGQPLTPWEAIFHKANGGTFTPRYLWRLTETGAIARKGVLQKLPSLAWSE